MTAGVGGSTSMDGGTHMYELLDELCDAWAECTNTTRCASPWDADGRRSAVEIKTDVPGVWTPCVQ